MEEAIHFLQEKGSGFYEVLSQMAANEYFVESKSIVEKN